MKSMGSVCQCKSRHSNMSPNRKSYQWLCLQSRTAHEEKWGKSLLLFFINSSKVYDLKIVFQVYVLFGFKKEKYSATALFPLHPCIFQWSSTFTLKGIKWSMNDYHKPTTITLSSQLWVRNNGKHLSVCWYHQTVLFQGWTCILFSLASTADTGI